MLEEMRDINEVKMAKEIELKYKVKDKSYREMAESHTDILQAYLSVNPVATVRVRLIGKDARITVKGLNHGCSRDEWEYAIPTEDAREMIGNCCEGKYIDKTRYYVPYGTHTWEVDEFHGSLEGLVIAEVEMKSSDEHPALPSFVGEEVTGDQRFYNSMLSQTSGVPE